MDNRVAANHRSALLARDSRTGAQRLVSYLVRITPQGNVRVSTRFRFPQLSSAVKNGVPPFFTALDSWVNLNLVETRTFPGGVVLTRFETRR